MKTTVADFFNNQDELKRMRKLIKRRIVSSFDDPEIRMVVMNRPK
jgi:hypothetical protein